MKSMRLQPVWLALPVIALALSPVCALAQSTGARARITQPVDTSKRVSLRGNVHPLARQESDRGAAPDSLPVGRMLLVLQRSPEQETALRQLLDGQQMPSSPQFHQWLTPRQFGEQFGPADSDLQAVTGWISSQGFEVEQIAAGRTVIEFSGTAGLVRQSLGTEIHKYRVNGAEYWANVDDPQIPAALVPVVAGFASLNNFPRTPMSHSLGTFRRSRSTSEVQPLFTFPVSCGPGVSGSCYYFGVGPADFATIYNVQPLWAAGTDGTGQTIAVVGETNINPQDVADFRSMFGLPPNQPNIILNGPDPGINSDERESDLDVQWSGAVAKGATIDLVVSESTETTAGIDLSALYIVDNDLAPVLSESYSACEAYLGAGGNQFYFNLWEQAAAQGITVLISSADAGSAGCDYYTDQAAKYGLAVSGIASTPFNVAVGGTDFNLNAQNAFRYWSTTNSAGQVSAKSHIPEITWNDSCAASGSLTGCSPPPNANYFQYGEYLLAGSGGPSSCTNPTGTFPHFTCSGNYAKPAWQVGVTPNDGARDLPDVSLFAGNGFHYTFYLMCQMDANGDNGGTTNSCELNAPYTDFQSGSGTSAAVQVFAGMMALVNQKYGRQGNPNYVLYQMAANPGASCNSSTQPSSANCIFYDVTQGNNAVICVGGSSNCSNTNSASGQFGVTVSGGEPAYQAGTGYDLATGLGTVNAANLVNKWTSNFASSATTLSLSTNPATNPITLIHGTPINFAIDVASGSGAPGGDVSLIAQTGSSPSGVTAIGPFTLNGSNVSDSTNLLPGGSYTVTAHYPGDPTHAASDSSPGIPVTVNKEPSQTEIRLVTFNPTTGVTSYAATTAAYGSPYILRMDVTDSSGQPCAKPSSTGKQLSVVYPCPTGSLTVSPAPTDQNPPAGTVPGSYQLNAQGYAEDQPIQLSTGTYSFLASYNGDNSYTASSSPPVSITITKAPTTLAISGLPSSVLGSHVVFYANISTQSNGAVPTGSVQLLNNGVVVGSPVNIYGNVGASGTYANAQGAFVIDLPLGMNSISVQYSGDGNYARSTSAAIAVSNADFTLTGSPNPITISAPGNSGSSALSISTSGLPATTIGLSCVTQYVGTSCTISPPGFNNITGSQVLNATITITTTGQAAAVSTSRSARVPPGFRSTLGWPWLLAALLAVATLVGLASASRSRTTLLFGLTLLIAGVWAACGGGGGGGGSTLVLAPVANLSPSTLTFNSPSVGATSSAQSVTLQNTGNASLSIASVTVGGANPGDFAQTNNCASSVASAASCAINVTFTPTTSGPRSASLNIADNAGGSPQSISLTGSVTAMPVASLSPPTLSFGQENEGVAAALQTLTLANNGSALLSISSIAIQGPNFWDFVQSNTCGASVAAGANCSINVQFKPESSGYTSTASLAVTDNAPASPQTSSLTGIALGPVTPQGNFWVNVSAEGEATGAQGYQEWFHQIQLTVAVQ